MPTDYEKVRRDNIEEYGKGTRHLEFLGRLYSDRTHFIYELLQLCAESGYVAICVACVSRAASGGSHRHISCPASVSI